MKKDNLENSLWLAVFEKSTQRNKIFLPSYRNWLNKRFQYYSNNSYKYYTKMLMSSTKIVWVVK